MCKTTAAASRATPTPAAPAGATALTSGQTGCCRAQRPCAGLGVRSPGHLPAARPSRALTAARFSDAGGQTPLPHCRPRAGRRVPRAPGSLPGRPAVPGMAPAGGQLCPSAPRRRAGPSSGGAVSRTGLSTTPLFFLLCCLGRKQHEDTDKAAGKNVPPDAPRGPVHARRWGSAGGGGVASDTEGWLRAGGPVVPRVTVSPGTPVPLSSSGARLLGRFTSAASNACLCRVSVERTLRVHHRSRESAGVCSPKEAVVTRPSGDACRGRGS